MEILQKINWVDILVLIVVLRTGYVALQDGFSHEILPLIGSFFMIICSLHYYQRVSKFVYDIGFMLPIEMLYPVVFLVLAILIGLLFRLVKAIIDKLIKVSWHPLVEKFGGLVTGLARGAVLVSMILIFLTLLPLPYLQWSVRDRSLTGLYFLRIGPELYEKTSMILPGIKLGGERVNSKELMKGLTSDKTIAPKTEEKKKKD